MEDKVFLLEYEYDNKQWAMEFYAKSWEDAKLKLQALKETIKISGTLEGTIPVWETTINNQQN